MPLLCISLLALLLLPLSLSLSLSCDRGRSLEGIKNDYMILKTDLDVKREKIATLLQNSSCSEPKHKLPSCTSGNTDVVSTLHNLTCKMKNLRLSHTDGLVSVVLHSIRCSCLERPTKKPNVKRTTAATRKRRNEQKISKKETRKLCKAKAILSSMTECYQILNTISMGT